MSPMEQAYRVAAVAVRQRFVEQHPADLARLDRLTADKVAVYSGTFDRVEKVLQYLQVPAAMDPDPRKIKASIAFVNCSGSYGDELIEGLRDRVTAGTWLVSSDWALGNFLARAFPNTVRAGGRATDDEVISVEPSLDSLWSEVVVLGADPQWWLEGSSHPIEILDRELVTVEAASHELLVKYGAPVVAVRFPWGRGRVFHVISHFWCKRSRTPAPRYRGPCTDFLRQGMRLSDEGIATVLQSTGIQPDTLNFAQLQSAATATELVAQLCVRAQPSAVSQTAASKK